MKPSYATGRLVLKNFRIVSYQRRGDEFIWSCYDEKGNEYASRKVFDTAIDARKEFDEWVEKQRENREVIIEE